MADEDEDEDDPRKGLPTKDEWRVDRERDKQFNERERRDGNTDERRDHDRRRRP